MAALGFRAAPKAGATGRAMKYAGPGLDTNGMELGYAGILCNRDRLILSESLDAGI